MGTISNALSLLNHYSETRAEIGLAEFKQLSGRDKATTYRYLTELVDFGLLEQDPVSRHYRLGPAVLRLANVRESVFPLRNAIQAIIDRLSEATSETAHASLMQGLTLSTLAKRESPKHAARVSFSQSQIIPLHATASGLAILATSDDKLLEQVIKGTPERYTVFTHADEAALRDAVAKAAQSGFGISDQGYEEEVYGIAVPFFDEHACAIGTVAVACPTSRVSPELTELVKRELIVAGRASTKTRGGTIPAKLEEAWSRSGF
ncbi:IclR family transcriptional regulator [Nitratireductor sp. XY-223]|uniref:IclR family transcriptional regulator n=1 Tax=Nitratireductor sp. XY-223 TaxID=2561926 RepID=UPI0010AAFACB|nr:IclR family transcriptional regulator [Nitratireductor sp. XY-223]